MFSDLDDRLGQSEVADALMGCDSEVLASHCLTDEQAEMLRRGDDSELLETRGQNIKSLTSRFVSARAERDLPVRRTIDELLYGTG